MPSFMKLNIAVVCLVVSAVFAAFPFLAKAQQASKPTELVASLRLERELPGARQQMPALRWQRISPTTGSLDGPVLYAIIIRSNATAGNLPKISPTYTLTNSLVSESSGVVSIGGTTSVAAFMMATGAGPGKVFTSDNSGNASWQSPLSISITAGTGLSATPNPITSTGTINIANGGVGNAQLASNAVQSGNIASGQVVKSLNGLFDGVTLNAGSNITITPSGQMLTIAAAAAPLVRTVVVSPVPGDTTASGTALVNALAGIIGASATNSWLLKIEPGVYDLGTGALTMKPFVDVEGSGEDVTTITAAGNASITTGTVLGSSNAELRYLTVKNTGGNSEATAIANVSASPRLMHVTALSAGGTTQSQGVYNNNASPVMDHVTATASGTVSNVAVLNVIGSAPVMNDVVATATGGSNNTGILSLSSAGTMTRVTVNASGPTSNTGVTNSASSPSMNNVSITVSGGTTTNSGVQNENSSGVGSSPQMNQITVTVSAPGSTGSNHAIVNSLLCSPTMSNITANSSGGHDNTAIENDANVPNMINITAVVSGGTFSTGMIVQGSTTLINSVVAASSATSSNLGVETLGFSAGSSTLNVNNSRISGSTSSISSQLSGGAAFAVGVGASQLAGPVSTGGGNTYTCVGAYSGTFTALNATCQ